MQSSSSSMYLADEQHDPLNKVRLSVYVHCSYIYESSFTEVTIEIKNQMLV